VDDSVGAEAIDFVEAVPLPAFRLAAVEVADRSNFLNWPPREFYYAVVVGLRPDGGGDDLAEGHSGVGSDVGADQPDEPENEFLLGVVKCPTKSLFGFIKRDEIHRL